MKLLKSLFILFSCIAFVGVTTNAYLYDLEPSSGNRFSAGTWFVPLIKINEVYYDVGNACGNEGNDTNPDEWVELYNPTSASIDLKNWTLTDNSSTITIHSASKIIPPGGFAIVSKDAKTWTGSVGCWSPPGGAVKIVTGQKIGNGLDNSGDRLILKDSSGQEMDTVSWGTDVSQLNPSVTPVANGHSIERSPLGTDTNTASDWSDNAAPSPGTP